VIHNLTKDTLLASREQWALTAAARMRGLLDHEGLEEGEALVISPCNSVHMFFMRFPIDVVFTTAEGVVVRAISNLRPWRFTRIHFGARHAIELPVGVVASSDTCNGDRLSLDLPPEP
jgi:uncharacterized membrane protein (UPF0127 family)